MTVQKVHNAGNERIKGNYFQYYCVHRQIALTEDIDAGFSTTTYDNGILRMLIPKTKLPVFNTPVAIVVH